MTEQEAKIEELRKQMFDEIKKIKSDLGKLSRRLSGKISELKELGK